MSKNEERLIHKAYKFRIYPNQEQESIIQKTFGCCRFVYNYLLGSHQRLNSDMWAKVQALVANGTLEQNNWKSASYNKFEASRAITELKKAHEWLKEVDSNALIAESANLDVAFSRMYKKLGRAPRFKTRNSRKSYFSAVPSVYAKLEKYQDTDKWLWEHYIVDTERGAIKISKLGWVKAKLHQQITCHRITGMTISQDAGGAYYCSLRTSETITSPTPKEKEVAVAFGLKTTVLSDGTRYERDLTHYEALKLKIQKEQRKWSRMEPGSENWKKQKLKIGKLKVKQAEFRKHFIQYISKQIADNYGVVYLQNLNIAQLLQNRENSELMGDASIGFLKELIRYKVDWANGIVVEVPSNYPSKRMCSTCGEVRDTDLREHVWTCESCGAKHERFTNASENLLTEGRRLHVSEELSKLKKKKKQK